VIALLAPAAHAGANPIRVALFHTELERKAPGLLFRDIGKGSADILAAARRVAKAQADVVVLLGVDFDVHNLALWRFSDRIFELGGPDYPHAFSTRPNTGMPSGMDLDGDGRTGTPRDAQGYGRFSGQGGMGILSRFPILDAEVEDHSATLWAEFAWADLPRDANGLFPSDAAYDAQRLSTTGHWVVPISMDDQTQLRLGVFHTSPPAFDGPEDRNGKRNADEIRFWTHYLDGTPPEKDPVIIGDANLDPLRGDGTRSAIRSLLSHLDVTDPFPENPPTVDWSGLGLGRLRTDYILPSLQWQTLDQGLIWPDTPHDDESRHALVWVDLIPNPIPTPAKLELSPANE
jgi:hypothetical protein